MSIKPADLLISAKSADNLGGEIVIRNVMSRSYYAAYHRAHEIYPPNKEFMSRVGGGVHTSYIDQLMQSAPGTTTRAVAVRLKTMKENRTVADYKLERDIKAAEGAMQIRRAEEVFELLSAESKSEGNEEMVAAPATSTQPTQEKSTACRPTLQRVK